MAERLPDRDPQQGLEVGWELLLMWPDGLGSVAEVFSTEAKVIEECRVRNYDYNPSLYVWAYRYRPGWVSGDELKV